MPIIRALEVIGVAYATAVGFYPALGWERRRRLGLLGVLASLLLLLPLGVPAQARFLRCLVAIAAVALVVKLYDLHVGADQGSRPNLGRVLGFLPNIFLHVLRREDQVPRPSRRADLAQLGRVSLGTLAGGGLFLGLFLGVDWGRYPFALEHCSKVIALFLWLIPLSMAAAAVWRLAGGPALEMMDHPYAARTPAEFWRRYNRPVQQFFREDLFRPLGGRRAAVRATLLVFVVSAAIHEYVFAVPIGRVTGYQTLFFLLQGCGVAATRSTRPRSWRAAAGVAVTLAFNLATSVLFFASINGVVPFYVPRRDDSPFPLPPTYPF